MSEGRTAWEEQVAAVRTALGARLERVRALALEALDPEGDECERTLREAITHELEELGVVVISAVCPGLYEQLRCKAALLQICGALTGEVPPPGLPLVPEKVVAQATRLARAYQRWKSEAEEALVEVERLKQRNAELEAAVAGFAETAVEKAVH